MKENGTSFLPGVMVLPEGKEIQVDKNQLDKLEGTNEMVMFDDLEIKI